jgi:hypothetical protein
MGNLFIENWIYLITQQCEKLKNTVSINREDFEQLQENKVFLNELELLRDELELLKDE